MAKKAELGRVVPNFELPAYGGGAGDTFNLKDYRGRKVLLFFYPQDLTPTCTQQSCDFRDAHERFVDADTVVVGISPDPVKSHEKFAAKHGLPFILLADEKLKACALFDVWKEKQLYGRKYMGVVRSTFLIDRKGKLVREWRNVRLKGHIDAVLEAAAKL